MTRIERYKKDIAALEKEYGKLKEGSKITVDLLEMATLCPRTYCQVKAYNGLASFISRTRKATVEITSQIMDGKLNN